MKADEVWIWLQPLKNWLDANVGLESDPEEKWHQAALAWQMVQDCYMDCAQADDPLWVSDLVDIDLEIRSDEHTGDENPPLVDEVPDLQGDDTLQAADSEPDREEASEVRDSGDEALEPADETVEQD